VLGYHDCPPPILEALDPVYDAKWVRVIGDIRAVLEEATRHMNAAVFANGFRFKRK
jgi:hypothetical protein